LLAIFDMDGTLVDSSITLANAINYVRAKLGLKPLKKEVILEQINNPNCNLPKFFYEIDTLEPIHEQLFSQYYSANHDRELVLFSGVKQMLEELKQKNIKLAIATNAYRKSTLEALSHLQIDRYFDDIVCFDDVNNGKPSPDMLLLLLKRTKESRKTTVFVGDSDRDKLAAKAAGIKYISVINGKKRVDFKEITRKIVEFLYNNNSNLIKE